MNTVPYRPMPSPFDDACDRIRVAYDELGHDLGWRFLTSPSATFDPRTEIALITLNPGGDRDRPDHPRESSEAGSAYIVEKWKSAGAAGGASLQMQIRRLFQLIAETRGLPLGGDGLLSKSLSAQFVPFRSPNLGALPRRKEAWAFASSLWAEIFEHIAPKLVVTIDGNTFTRLLPIVEAKWGASDTQERLPTGWGNVSAELVRWNGSGGGRAVLRLPHLSTFKLFSRDACRPFVYGIVEDAVRTCWGSGK